MATGILIDVFPQTPITDLQMFQYSEQPFFDYFSTWPRRRPQKPLFKPLFDEHYTPVSKVPAAKELPSQLIVRELTPEADSDFDSTSEPATPIHQPSQPPPPDPIPLTPTKARSPRPNTTISPKPILPAEEKSSPSHRSCLSPAVTITDNLVSERISAQKGTSPRSSPPSSEQSSSMSSVQHQSYLEQEMNEFWLSSNHQNTLHHLVSKGRPRRFDRPSKPIKYPLTLGFRPKNDDESDTASMSSYSVLSDDTIPPPSPPSRIERLTLTEETLFFNDIYNQISDAFDEWEAQLRTKGRSLSDLEQSDRFIDLPIIYEKDVLMGKRPDDKGFWTGGFRLRGRTHLHKLIAESGKLVYGFECGWIDDFHCRTYAVLLMGSDKCVYYYDEDGDILEHEDGDYSYYANGPFDLRKFGTAHVLDPYLSHISIAGGSEDLIAL
jgi:hypothetical protein